MDTPTTNQPQQEQKKEEPKQEEKPKETIREIHHHHYERRHGFSFGRLGIGLILIFVGLVYLAQTTGWLHLTLNVNWWKLWPLLIIFFGLSLLAGRGWFSGLIGLIITLAVLGIVALVIFSPGNTTTVAPTEKTIAISQDTGATDAVVNIKAGAGTLLVKSSADHLVSGTFISNVTDLSTVSALAGGTQTVDITQGNWNVFGIGRHTNDLTLGLGTVLPTTLSVDSGAIDMNLDLVDVVAKRVDINTGASSLKLALGDKVDQSVVEIDAGASSLSLSLPATVGVKMVIDSGLSSKNLPNLKDMGNNTFESNNYSSSAKKIDVTLKVGVSSLNVSWR